MVSIAEDILHLAIVFFQTQENVTEGEMNNVLWGMQDPGYREPESVFSVCACDSARRAK